MLHDDVVTIGIYIARLSWVDPVGSSVLFARAAVAPISNYYNIVQILPDYRAVLYMKAITYVG